MKTTAPAAPTAHAVATINLVTDWTKPGVHLPVFAGAQVTKVGSFDAALAAATRLSDGAATAQGIFMRENDGVRSYELRALETLDFTMEPASLGTARHGLELLGSGSNPSVRDSTGREISSSASIGSDTSRLPLRPEFGMLITMVDGPVAHTIQHM
jgi:hypothetical protein